MAPLTISLPALVIAIVGYMTVTGTVVTTVGQVLATDIENESEK